jgi:hypothetical protein
LGSRRRPTKVETCYHDPFRSIVNYDDLREQWIAHTAARRVTPSGVTPKRPAKWRSNLGGCDTHFQFASPTIAGTGSQYDK